MMKIILTQYPEKYQKYLGSFCTFCESPEENVVASAGLILCLLVGHHRHLTNPPNIQKAIMKLEELEWHASYLVKKKINKAIYLIYEHFRL